MPVRKTVFLARWDPKLGMQLLRREASVGLRQAVLDEVLGPAWFGRRWRGGGRIVPVELCHDTEALARESLHPELERRLREISSEADLIGRELARMSSEADLTGTADKGSPEGE